MECASPAPFIQINSHHKQRLQNAFQLQSSKFKKKSFCPSFAVLWRAYWLCTYTAHPEEIENYLLLCFPVIRNAKKVQHFVMGITTLCINSTPKPVLKLECRRWTAYSTCSSILISPSASQWYSVRSWSYLWINKYTLVAKSHLLYCSMNSYGSKISTEQY